MIAFIFVIHIIVCILLIGIILVQAGRGGGLVDAFSGVESMFGTKTNTFLTRTTTVLSIVFFITCLSLALLSARQSRSLLKDIKAPKAGPAEVTQEQSPTQMQTKEAQAQTETQQEGIQKQEPLKKEKAQNSSVQEKTPVTPKAE